MFTYFVFLAAITLVGVPLCRNKVGKAVYCSIAGAALFVFAAIRRYVGYDYNMYGAFYMDYMFETNEEISRDRLEKAFAMTMKLLSSYFPDYQTIHIFIAFIIAVAVGLALHKYCDRPYLGVFFFLTLGTYYNSLNFARQIVACAILMFGFRFLNKDQFYRYCVVVLFASTFHLSILLMIPFFFILKIRMTPVTLGVYAVLSIPIMFFMRDMMKIAALFGYHFYEAFETSGELNQGQPPIYMIYFGLIFAFCFAFRRRLTAKDPFNNVWLNCAFFLFWFEMIGARHGELSRLSMPFMMPTEIILLPRVFECMLEWCAEKFGKDRKTLTISSAIAAAVVIIGCTGMYEYMAAVNYNGVSPYQTVFNAKLPEAKE